MLGRQSDSRHGFERESASSESSSRREERKRPEPKPTRLGPGRVKKYPWERGPPVRSSRDGRGPRIAADQRDSVSEPCAKAHNPGLGLSGESAVVSSESKPSRTARRARTSLASAPNSG